MINFPKEFFKDEERSGFVVNEAMKRNWAAQMEVLRRITDICEKYDITYYIYWGSLLGTVRHGGFIPWDDDLDIAMLGDDYVRFLEVAAGELPAEYEILNMYTLKDWDNYFTRIVNGDVEKLTLEYAKQYHDCPMIVGVDVFPLYYVPRDKETAMQQKEILRFLSLGGECLENGDEQGWSDFTEQIEELCGYRFNQDKTLRTQINLLFDQFSRLSTAEESDEVTSYIISIKRDYSFKKELYVPIKMNFENISVTVPSGYDEILTKTFGDYRIPIRGTASHEYPNYKKQMKIYGDRMEVRDICVKTGSDSPNVNVEVNSAGSVVPKEYARNELPERWYELVYGNEGRKKKVLLYHTGATDAVVHGDRLVEKIRSTIKVAEENPEVILWWFPCSVDNEEFEIIHMQIPDAIAAYRQLVEECKANNNIICDMSGDFSRAVRMSDAYYGDEGILADVYKKTGKPIMIQNYDLSK